MKGFFCSFAELEDNLSRGGEIEFKYNKKNYSMTHVDGKIHVMEKYNEESLQVFDYPEEVGMYPIGDKFLKDLLPNLIITFRCF